MRSALFTLGATLLAAKVAAHGLVASVVLDGVKYEGYPAFYDPGPPKRVIRAMHNNGPIENVNSAAIACNGDGSNAPAALVAPVTAGSTVDYVWDAWPEGHKGPITNYMASCNGDCTKFNQADAKWFKVDESGYFGNNVWATDKLISNGLKYSFKVPNNIPDGEYLIRHEILALHTVGAPQYYPSCTQVKLKGGSGALPSKTVSFPGAYSPADPGYKINIYYPAVTSYLIEGPAVIAGGSSIGNSASVGSSSPAPGSSSSKAPVATSVVVSSSAAPATTKAAVSTSVYEEPTVVPTSVVLSTSIAAAPSSTKVTSSATAPASTKAATSADPATSAAASPTKVASSVAAPTTTAPASSTKAAVTSAHATTAPATATPAVKNHQKYTGAVGGIVAPVVTSSKNGYKVANDRSYHKLITALTRSCEVQKKLCYKKAYSPSSSEITTAQCKTQGTKCLAVAHTCTANHAKNAIAHAPRFVRSLRE